MLGFLSKKHIAKLNLKLKLLALMKNLSALAFVKTRGPERISKNYGTSGISWQSPISREAKLSLKITLKIHKKLFLGSLRFFIYLFILKSVNE